MTFAALDGINVKVIIASLSINIIICLLGGSLGHNDSANLLGVGIHNLQNKCKQLYMKDVLYIVF